MKETLRTWAVTLAAALCASLAAGAEPIGTVVTLQGRVRATAADGAERILAERGPVFAGDVLESGAGARLQLLFADDSILALGENARLTLDRFVYDPKNAARSGFGAHLLRGLMRVVTGKIAEAAPDRFEVRTGRATVGIRGCSLGFEAGADVDTIYAVWIPSGRSVSVRSGPAGERADTGTDDGATVATATLETRTAEGRTLRRGRFFAPWFGGGTSEIVLRGAGVVIVTDTQMIRRPFRPADLQHLSGGTGPTGPGNGPAGGGGPGNGPPPPPGPGPNGPPPPGPPGSPRGKFGGNTFQRLPVTIRPGTPLTAALFRLQRAGSGGAGTGGILPESSEPALFGAGLGGRYRFSVPGWAWLSEVDVYGTLSGGKVNGRRSAGSLHGVALDANLAVLGAAPIRNFSVPLLDLGTGTAYFGYDAQALDPSTLAANDNLQEFVRLTVEPASPDGVPELSYWGLRYPGARPKAGAVTRYEVAAMSLPAYFTATGPIVTESPEAVGPEASAIVGPSAVTAPQALQYGNLLVNTKTGGFVLLGGGGDVLDFGTEAALAFFGSEAQGVGYVRVEPGPQAVAAAGFRAPEATPAAAESGAWSYRGYAIGGAVSEAPSTIDPPYLLASARAGSDAAADNQGRVRVAVDKDRAGNNVAASLDLQALPPPSGALGTPRDLVLANPSGSTFVQGNLYGAAFEQGGTKASLSGTPDAQDGAGADWSWGEWNGERTDPANSEAGAEKVKGEYVAGNVLSQAGFDQLKNGSMSYQLATPEGRPGRVSALVTPYLSTEIVGMKGTASLQVQLGQGTANWSGQFSASDPADASRNLSVSVGTTAISAGGHLSRDTAPDAFQLNVGGQSYDRTRLTGHSMTGNLVGPGPGHARPVTGAIGEGQFETDDHTRVLMQYGADLE